MAQRYGKNPHIAAWQIDNEMGGICYCDSCRRGFRQWLEQKYHSIEKVNEAWGTVFWSQTYRSFSEIEIPGYNACDGFCEDYPVGNTAPGAPWSHNPGLLLDYYRYSSDAKIEFIRLQTEAVRRESTIPVTHNLMAFYGDIDYFKLGKNLDFVSWDNYVNTMWGKESWQHTAMAHEIIRGIENQKFWVMEQQSGPCGWQMLGDTPEPGQLRLWTYQAIAHGAEAILYFRWRACLFGTEQNWYGILDHDGRAGRRYREIQRIGEEIGRISEHLEEGKEESQVLLVRDYDNLWSHRGQPHNAGFNYDRLLQQYYEALSALQINVDVSGLEKDWKAYKLVVMPALGMVTGKIAEKCRRYVETGGSLLLTFRSGIKEWTNGMTDQILPGWFRELAGVTVEEFDSLNFGRQVQIEGDFGTGTASVWCDVLQADTADVKAVYRDHYYARHPAVTVNNWGEGKVYYVGCDLDSAGMDSLMKEIAGECELSGGYEGKDKDLEIVVKESSTCRYIYLLNHSKESREVMPDRNYKELLTGHMEEGKQILEPFGVKIWMEEKADRILP